MEKLDENNTLKWWITIVGSEYEAKNYSYTFELYGTNSITRSTITGQVFSIDETSQKIKEENNCFGINFDTFKKHFLTEDNKCTWSLSIKNMKEEVKDENVESGISDNDE